MKNITITIEADLDNKVISKFSADGEAASDRLSIIEIFNMCSNQLVRDMKKERDAILKNGKILTQKKKIVIPGRA